MLTGAGQIRRADPVALAIFRPRRPRPFDWRESGVAAKSLRTGRRYSANRGNPNRGGHGIPPRIVQEEVTSTGFVFARRAAKWPDEKGEFFLALFRKP
jgi:hypothetical protein